jgi:TonB family protein
MARHQSPDTSQPASSATGEPCAQSPESPAPATSETFEADLVSLVARFVDDAGGGLTPELSADLALDLVLNEIVEQACLATSASGASIILDRQGVMTCRASSGETARELGARLQKDSGLSRLCLDTGEVQSCDDALTDTRVDTEACRRMGVRSILIMPLMREAEIVGLFEIFSSRTSAFGERDRRTLEALSYRVLQNLDLAFESLSALRGTLPAADPVEDTARLDLESADTSTVPTFPESERTPWEPAFERITWAMGALVFLSAILLLVVTVRRLGWMPVSSRASASSALPLWYDSGASGSLTPQEPPPQPVRSSRSQVQAANLPSPDSLLVYENGKEVFRTPASGVTSDLSGTRRDGIERVSSIETDPVVELSSPLAGSSILRGVEPDYPEQALQQGVQGPVVLEIHIGQDGRVREVTEISGPPLLVKAATDVVRKWQFKPRVAGGRRVEMQTTITLNFRLSR